VRRDWRQDGILAQIRIERDRIGAIAAEGFDGVFLGGGADVAAFGVEDHRYGGVGIMRVLDQPQQRVFRAERCEVRDLRLEAAHQVGSGVDDGAVEFEQRIGPQLQMGRKLFQLRIPADAQQAVVGLLRGVDAGDELHLISGP
jgi:hypothetical protein